MQSADELLAKYSQRLSDLIPEEMPEEKTEEEATRADEAPVWEAMQAAEELPDEKSDEATRAGEVPVGQAVQSADELLAKYSQRLSDLMPEEKATRADEAPVWEAMQAAEELPGTEEATRDGEAEGRAPRPSTAPWRSS